MQNCTIIPDKHLCYILSDQNSYAKSKWVGKKTQKHAVDFSFCTSLILSEKTHFSLELFVFTTVLAQELSIFP